MIDHEALVPHRGELRAQLSFEGQDFGLRRRRVFAECLGIVRVDRRQFFGNQAQPERGVARVKPGMGVYTARAMIM